MDKVSMSYLFSFSGYQTKCVIEFLFRQLMTSWTLSFIFDHHRKQWPTRIKRGKDRNTKNEYLENKKRFLDEIKNIFHSFWMAMIWWKNKNLMKIADTSFKHQLHQIVKHTQIIRRVLPTNFLSVCDHFVGLALKGLRPCQTSMR